jgi:hypothetical protein
MPLWTTCSESENLPWPRCIVPASVRVWRKSRPRAARTAWWVPTIRIPNGSIGSIRQSLLIPTVKDLASKRKIPDHRAKKWHCTPLSTSKWVRWQASEQGLVWCLVVAVWLHCGSILPILPRDFCSLSKAFQVPRLQCIGIDVPAFDVQLAASGTGHVRTHRVIKICPSINDTK